MHISVGALPNNVSVRCQTTLSRVPTKGFMNLEEVARLAGVSRSTVSRVVNGDRRVSDGARSRVQEIIREYNYHPNAAARSLASARTRIIGLLIPHGVSQIFHDPFFPILIQGTVEACNQTDYNLTMIMETAEEGIASDRVYQRVVRGRHVDGLVIASSVVEDPIIARLQQDGFPFVLVGRHPRHEVSFVDVDNRSGAREAVAHLLEHGFKRIAMIAGPRNMIASIDRYAGYVTALQEDGRLPDPDLMIHSDFTRRGGYRAMNEILARPVSRPDAVFVASDAMASGALQALRDANIEVPRDMAVMGFDGLEETLVSRPILSTIVQPTIDEGREAVRILLELVHRKEEGPPIQRYLPTELALRRSCGCGSDPVPMLTAVDSMSGGELTT
jgi:LacI family transcriptional regulator